MHIIVFFPRCGDFEKYVSRGLRIVDYSSHFLPSTTRQLAIIVSKKIYIELLL